MKTNKKVSDKQIIDMQNKIIAQKEEELKLLRQKVSNTSRNKLVDELDQTKKEIKKGRKFNVGAWLAASCFSIFSCIFGLVNLILNLTKK